jgi:phage gpG-like protein
MSIKLPSLDINIDIIARECIDMIKDRTARGLDVNGTPFKPYSKMTVAKKGTTDVTLKDTGRLLNSLHYSKTSDSSFTIEFGGIPYAHKVMNDRPILGLTEQEQAEIVNMINRQLFKEGK